jgi:hypothetical protein
MLNVSYAEGHIQALHAECHYAECHYTDCCGTRYRRINSFDPWSKGFDEICSNQNPQ